MPWFRAYIENANNGEFVRISDGEADSAEAHEKALKLKKGEKLTQVVDLTFADQAHIE